MYRTHDPDLILKSPHPTLQEYYSLSQSAQHSYQAAKVTHNIIYIIW